MLPNVKMLSVARLPVAALLLVGCSVDAPLAVQTPPAATVLMSSSLATPYVAPMLQTSLDNIASVMRPAYGVGGSASVTTFPANDFLVGHRASGLMANAVGERVLYPQIENGIQNVELDHGTMDFWYRPNYNHDDNVKYTIAGTGSWHHPLPNGLHFGKHNSSNKNQLFLIYFDSGAVRKEHNVLSTSYSWKAGVWQHIVITWDFTVAAGQQNLHIYLNNVDLPLIGTVTRGPQVVPAESAAEQIYIGSRDVSGGITANGMYDQFRILRTAVAPI